MLATTTMAPKTRSTGPSQDRVLGAAARTAAPRTRSWLGPVLLVLGAIVVVASIGTIAADQLHLLRIQGLAVKDARVTIETRPPAAQVLIDGQPRGTTPIVLLMKPGAHTMMLRSGLEERVVTLSVAAGAVVTQHLEM